MDNLCTDIYILQMYLHQPHSYAGFPLDKQNKQDFYIFFDVLIKKYE